MSVAERTPAARPSLSQQARVRLIWLRIHRWLGLGGLVALFFIAVTGSAITYAGGYERLFHPERFPDGAGTAIAPSQLAAQARATLPADKRLAGLLYGDGPRPNVMGGSEVVAPAALGLGPPQRAKVWMDPRNGTVLNTSDGRPDMIWFAYATHGDLLISRWVIVLAGIALLISSISGIYLWWPGTKRVWQALKWRKQFTKNMNLHRISGALMAIVLVIEAVTGLYIAYPAVMTAWVDGKSAGGEAEEGPPPSRPMASPRQNVDDVLNLAISALPQHTLQSIWFPTEAEAKWTVNLMGNGGARMVTIEDATAQANVHPPAQPTRGQRATQLMLDIHSGNFGPIYRLLIFVSGLALALLSITGIWLWAQGRKRAIR